MDKGGILRSIWYLMIMVGGVVVYLILLSMGKVALWRAVICVSIAMIIIIIIM